MTAFGARIEVIDEDVAAMLRRKTGAERLAIASRMFASARRMLLSHLRSTHPDWDERQIVQEAARRLSHGAL
jgi:Rv0078B-related antitoxin